MRFSLFFIGALAGTLILWGQGKPNFVGTADEMIIMPSLASRAELIPPRKDKREAQDGRTSRYDVVIGKDPQIDDDFYTKERNPLFQKKKGRAASIVFEAVDSDATPTDPTLAVGPNHVITVYNTGVRIFDKAGNPLTAAFSEANIFGSSGCCDLTSSYDNVADRWVLSILNNSGGARVAVSSGSNPLTSEWYVYNYSQVDDYQKLSIWSDGYYMTDNNGSFNKVYVFERDKMLLGDTGAQIIGFPLPGISTSGFFSPQAFNISDDNPPAPGNAPIVYMQDDAWSGVSTDHLKIWTINVDWANTSNSTVSNPSEINTTPFIGVFDGGSFSNLQQGDGVSLDALQATIMNQAQFRKFDTHNSAVFNFVVDADASSGEQAAIRWYELRQTADGQPWTIHQEGTYTSPNNKHAWNASLIMDYQGNIGMGYTAMGGNANKKVGSYYTGRLAADPLNTMTLAEELIAQGSSYMDFSRYGDYSKIDVDPDGDQKFWFINEYSNPNRKGVVGVFQIASTVEYDVGIIDITQPSSGTLTSTESVTVVINNYGQMSISNIPISLYVNNQLVATETYSGTIISGGTANFTFSQTVNLATPGSNFTLKACTGYEEDFITDNDCYSEVVSHFYTDDVGISSIISPVNSNNLGSQIVEVEISNYGTMTQTQIPVWYSVNGGAPIQETFTGSLEAGATTNYSFASSYNFATSGSFEILASTQLDMDGIQQNNSMSKNIAIYNCQMYQNQTAQSVGPDQGSITLSDINVPNNFIFADLNVTINIDHTYVEDLNIKLISPSGIEVLLCDGVGGSGNNFTNTYFDDSAADPISSGTAPFIGSYQPIGNLSDFVGENMQGDWTLSIEDTENLDGGTLNSWALEFCTALATEEIPIHDSEELIVALRENENYLIQLNEYQNTERVDLKIYSANGQLLKYNSLYYNGNAYQYDLDMSYAPSGTYIVEIGPYSKKILVP